MAGERIWGEHVAPCVRAHPLIPLETTVLGRSVAPVHGCSSFDSVQDERIGAGCVLYSCVPGNGVSAQLGDRWAHVAPAGGGFDGVSELQEADFIAVAADDLDADR